MGSNCRFTVFALDLPRRPCVLCALAVELDDFLLVPFSTSCCQWSKSLFSARQMYGWARNVALTQDFRKRWLFAATWLKTYLMPFLTVANHLTAEVFHLDGRSDFFTNFTFRKIFGKITECQVWCNLLQANEFQEWRVVSRFLQILSILWPYINFLRFVWSCSVVCGIDLSYFDCQALR